jgi:hypothetical protein
MSLNLHDIVRGAVQAVNDDQPGIVYIATGATLTRGIAVPNFNAVPAQLQIQATPFERVEHARGVLYSENKIIIYAYGNFDGIDRPDQTGGSVVQVTGTSDWYAVTQVLEWWPGWCCLEVTRQLNATNVQARMQQIQNGANPP